MCNASPSISNCTLSIPSSRVSELIIEYSKSLSEEASTACFRKIRMKNPQKKPFLHSDGKQPRALRHKPGLCLTGCFFQLLLLCALQQLLDYIFSQWLGSCDGELSFFRKKSPAVGIGKYNVISFSYSPVSLFLIIIISEVRPSSSSILPEIILTEATSSRAHRVSTRQHLAMPYPTAFISL